VRSTEGFSTTASGFGVGVSNLEPLAGQAIVEMNLGSPKVIKTVTVHGILNPRKLAHLIGWFGCSQAHAILKTRTTAWFNEYSQKLFGGRLAIHFFNLDQGGISEFYHAYNAMHCRDEVNSFVLQRNLCQKRKNCDIYQIFS
jgi:hypothetical protein